MPTMNTKMVALMNYGHNKGMFLQNIPNLTTGVMDREDSEESYCERYGRIVDDASVLDKFRWIEEKGLTPQLLDRETQIEALDEWLDKAASEYDERRMAVHDDKTWEDFCSWAKHMNDEETRLADLIYNTDKERALPEENSSKEIYSYIETYIDRFKLSEMPIILDVLDDNKIKGSIGWRTYVKCSLAVLARLHYNCPEGGWKDDYERFVKMNQVHHNDKCTSFEDRLYASMSLDMESAIDFMRKVRELAKLNYVSVQDMAMKLLEEMEDMHMPIEVGVIDVDDYVDMIDQTEYDNQFED